MASLLKGLGYEKSNTPATHLSMKMMQMVLMLFVHGCCWVQRNAPAGEFQNRMSEILI